LEHLTKEKPSSLDMANGYLALHDKFMPTKAVLDSVEWYLDMTPKSKAKNKALIHLYFNKKASKQLIDVSENAMVDANDAWTNYRIGQAYLDENKNTDALLYLKKAVKEMPLDLDFQEKLGVCYMRLEYFKEAADIFNFVLSEHPKRPLAYTNLGYIEVLKNNFKSAENYYLKAINLDPDLEQTCLNLAALYLIKKDKQKAKDYLERSLKINPNNEQAQYQLALLK
jgi:Flp pilus assembly protein TadD